MRLFEYLKLKKKILFVFLGSLFSLVAIFVGTFYVTRMRQEPSRSKAGGGVSLYFDPQSLTANVNSDFTLKVKINPASEKVTGVELRLDFDKDKIEINKIESTSTFSSVFIAPLIDNNQGKATVVVGISVEPPPPVPVVNIADVVVIKAKTKGVTGNAVVEVNQNSKAAAMGKDSNVIESYGQASLNIIPLPTATATPTVKPTATATPTVKPTATATPTVKPTATATPIGKIGDVNGDGKVNILDIGEIINHYRETGAPGWIRSDLNSDGIINMLDIGVVINHYRE
jgi:hypothetical protein